MTKKIIPKKKPGRLMLRIPPKSKPGSVLTSDQMREQVRKHLNDTNSKKDREIIHPD